MSAGKGDTTRPFDQAKWDASKLWKKPNMNTPRTDEILALLPGGQTCDPQEVADALRPAIERLEGELAAEREQIKSNRAATLVIERMLYTERALADRLAGEIESWASIAGDYTPMSADKAIAAWKQARNPAQTTTEGAE